MKSIGTIGTIGVIGAGGWGTALALLLAKRGHHIRLWGHNPEHIADLKQTRINTRYLPDILLPEKIEPTAALSDLANRDLLLIATPSRAIRETAAKLRETGIPEKTVLLSCTKGIEQGSGLRISEILAETFPENQIAVLSGPSHAEEVARNMPSAVVIGCANDEVAQRLQQTFSSGNFRAYTSADVAGIELGGALKNIFAIAAGASDGLGLGDNSKAALVTRALAEMSRLGEALGGSRETFQGLGGIGDLIVTCFSQHSRNRQVGERLGRGESITGILGSMRMVAEGVPTTKSAWECAQKLGVSAPIIEQVYAMLYEKKSTRDAMTELLAREPRPEQD